MKYVTNITIAAGVACTMLLGACGGEEQSELRQELAAMTKDLRGRVDPLPQVKSFEPVPYKGESMVDPFVPGRIVVTQASTGGGGGGGVQPDLTGRRNRWRHFRWRPFKWWER